MPSSHLFADPQLADTAAALAAWRSCRALGARSPDEPWLPATELARRFGVTKVAVALKLDYTTSLKRRLAATASSRAERARSTPQPADFVELNFRFPDLGGVLRQSSGIRCGTLFDQARGCSWDNLAHHVVKECEGVETVVASGFS